MIEGTLEIRWVNRDSPKPPRRYWVSFLAKSYGAQPHFEIVGEESLLNYLIGIQAATRPIERRTQRAQEWLLEIHSAGHLSLGNTQLTEEQFEVFRPI